MIAAHDDVRTTDVAIVGAGAAGLAAALALGDRRVCLVTKGRLGRAGASPHAQGGIAAAVGSDDAPEHHAADTIAASDGLADIAIARLLAQSGPGAIETLVELGTRFDRDENDHFDLGREAAHSRRRILHSKDATGAEIVRALTQAVRARPQIEILENAFAEDLVVDAARVQGVFVRDASGARVWVRARAVVLATGGIGRLYSHTTNPVEATGDGLAMAWRAGARLADVEFVQFHPTALACGADPMPLLTEALRGRGAHIIDGQGVRFLQEIGPEAELLSRDIVARAVWERLAEGELVFLDAREAVGDAFPNQFPTVFSLCQAHGIDPRTVPIPISPAAHYHMGGVRVDGDGRSSLSGLWACGEVACTGVHGANRLASNSLLEALVFGGRVARDIVASTAQAMPASLRRVPDMSPDRLTQDRDVEVVAAVRALMWRQVGVVREEAGLRSALRALESHGAGLAPGPSEARNLVDVARIVSSAALARKESRGGHFRSDYPHARPIWQRRIVVCGADFETSVELMTEEMRPPAALAGR
jgi:L-aspartate oxidase